MKQKAGFSLIELILSFGLLSIVLSVALKLKTLAHNRSQIFLEEQNLAAYVDVLVWTLENTNGDKSGIWFGRQDDNTRERKFVRNRIKKCVCWAEIEKKDNIYYATLRGETLKNMRVKPIKCFITKDIQN